MSSVRLAKYEKRNRSHDKRHRLQVQCPFPKGKRHNCFNFLIKTTWDTGHHLQHVFRFSFNRFRSMLVEKFRVWKAFKSAFNWTHYPEANCCLLHTPGLAKTTARQSHAALLPESAAHEKFLDGLEQINGSKEAYNCHITVVINFSSLLILW